MTTSVATNMRVCDTNTLIALCKLADQYEFNRRVDCEALEKDINPDGVHVLSMLIQYHRASFGPTRKPIWPDHHRCLVYCLVTGQDDPVTFFLDVPAAKWDVMLAPEEAMEES